MTCSVARQTPVTKQFRVPLDSNHYTVPPRCAGQHLKAYADRVCIYDHDQLVARHPRSMDRHKNIEDPDHERQLLAQRMSAREQRLVVISAEYIANILTARLRIGPEPAALQLTRRADLLELEIPEPDLSIYDRRQGDDDANTP